MDELLESLEKRRRESSEISVEPKTTERTSVEPQKVVSSIPVSLEFASMEEALKNPRIQMLLLRSEGVPHLKNFPVPLNEREIPLNLLTNKDSLTSMKAIRVAGSSQSFETRRQNALNVINSVTQNIISLSQDRLDRPQTLEDLVHEAETESVGFELWDFLTGSSRRRVRPLKPIRKERSTFTSRDPSGSLSSSKTKLIISILHANNVAVRSFSNLDDRSKLVSSDLFLQDSASSLKRRASSFSQSSPLQSVANNLTSEMGSSSRVNPFIEVVFGKEVARTSTAEGCHPTWNETLILELR